MHHLTATIRRKEQLGNEKQFGPDRVALPASEPSTIRKDSATTGNDGSGNPTGNTELHALCVAVLAFGGLAFLYFARSVLMPLVLAGIAGMTLKPVVAAMTHFYVPRLVASLLILAIVMVSIGSGFVYISRPAVSWVNQAPQHINELHQRLGKLFAPAEQFRQVATVLDNVNSTGPGKETEVRVSDSHAANTVFAWTGNTLVGLGETLVLLFLYLASGDCFSQKFVRMASTHRNKQKVNATLLEIQRNVSKYLFSISLINLTLGMIVAIGLFFMGVPNAALWGTLAVLLNFIPYFGPIAGVLLVGAVGLLTFDSLPRALLPALWYLALHLTESNVVTPMILGGRFTIHPVIVFVSLMFWSWLWGVTGALLSVPLLMAFKVICDRTQVLAPISEFLKE